MADQEVIGTFLRETNRWESSFADQSDTITGQIRTSQGVVSIKGQADRGELQQGLEYRFFGSFKPYKNRHNGKTTDQLNFSSFVESAPHDRESIIAYLVAAGEGQGLGKQRAAALFRKYDSEAVATAREQPEKVAEYLASCKLPISIEAAKAVAEILEAKKATEGVQIELASLLAKRGFPRSTIKAAIQKWGTKAAWLVKRDPFKLLALKGCGFKRCDEMWLDLGLPADRLKRQALCATHAVSNDSEGHAWFPAAKASSAISESITGANIDIDKALRLAIRAGLLSEEFSKTPTGPLTKTETKFRWLASSAEALAERRIAEWITTEECKKHSWPSVDSLAELTAHQREQLSKALVSPVAILRGSPGTGKTYTAAVLINHLRHTFGLKEIMVAAPTGKASVRLTENLVKHGLDVQARTMASYIQWLQTNGEEEHFPKSCLILDEGSMPDALTFADMLTGMRPGSHVLIIGDTNQLTPVGRGAPLRDLIAAGMPSGELRDIMRNSGGIVEACAAIRDNQPWGAGDNLIVTNDATPDEQIDSMLRTCREAKAAGFDPVWDVQVIAAVNEKSPLCRKKINDILQRELNLHPGQAGQLFRLNDKLVNTENGKFSVCSQLGDNAKNQPGKEGKEVYVANGELAKVVAMHDAYFEALLTAPDRLVKVFKGKQDSEGETSTCKMELGYGLTCHKMQGSSAKWVIVLLDTYPGASRICSREWLYTAISRAELRCFLVGEKATADRMCRNVSLWKRKTFLRELIAIYRAKRILAL